MLEWCEGCQRSINGRCEVFMRAYDGCFAKIKDIDKYIAELEGTREYNKKVGSPYIADQLGRRIKQVKKNAQVEHV